MKTCKRCSQPHNRPRADVCLPCTEKARRHRERENLASAIDFTTPDDVLTGTCVVCGKETDSPMIETCCKAHAMERNRRLEATRENPLAIRDKFWQVFETLELSKSNARKKQLEAKQA